MVQKIPSSLFRPSTTHLIMGAMGDDKYVEAVRLIRKVSYAGSSYQIFSPEVDPRNKNEKFEVKLEGIEKSIPIHIDIETAKNSGDILEKLKPETTTVGILGAHFFDTQIREVVQKLKKDGKYIVIAGIDKTFEGDPFGPMGYLAIDADIIKKVYPSCEVKGCENLATHTNKKSGNTSWGSDIIDVGENSSYSSVCLAHFKCHGSPEEKHLLEYRKKRKQSCKVGNLYTYFGTMSSGKSEMMVSRVLSEAKKQKVDYQFLKPSADTRTPNEIVSRSFKEMGKYGIRFPAIEINENNMWDFAEKTGSNIPKRIYGIDEVNLIPNVHYFINALRLMGHDVAVAGLAKEFKSELFGDMDYMICDATHVEPLEAVCTFEDCKNKATEVQRLINGEPAPYDSPTIIIEGEGADAMKVTYHPRCIFHHMVPGKPEFIQRDARRKK